LFTSPALDREEALTVLAMATGQPRDSLPIAAHRIAEMSGANPSILAAAGTNVRNGMSWERVLEEWDDSSATVNVTPLGLSIVLAKKGVDGPTFNLDCEFHNRRAHTQKIDLIEARLTDPHGASFSLRWTVFYETKGPVHRRTGDAGPFDVAPGETRLGIQFAGPPSMNWAIGKYFLELIGWLGGARDTRTPSFSASRDMFITPLEAAEFSRWSRASDAEWASLNDEAIGIPVRLSVHAEEGGHPWQFRISADRFIGAYSGYRPLQESARSGLHDFIERLNEDRNITDVAIAAYILATVQDETGGAFRPIEQRTPPQSSQKISTSLGNIDPGDVERYCGRGYILIEGRANYRRLSESLGMEKDLIRDPELLLDPNVAYQALRFVMLQGGLTGHRLTEFIQPGKQDYIAARRAAFGSSQNADRVAKNANIIERFLRDSLVPRLPSPSDNVA
jgi:putative chitinase